MSLVERIPAESLPEPEVYSKPAGPLTRADLDRMPDDGYRHELIDGALLVTPSPSWRHQTFVAGLYRGLHAACPPDLQVLFAPFDVALAPDTVMEPDVLVARRADFTERDLPMAPLLAVEVLSPSTRRFDLMVKWSRYQEAGCASYWVVDPDPDTPSVIVWELRDGAYVQVAKVVGDESVRLTSPFEVTLVPADLIS